MEYISCMSCGGQEQARYCAFIWFKERFRRKGILLGLLRLIKAVVDSDRWGDVKLDFRQFTFTMCSSCSHHEGRERKQMSVVLLLSCYFKYFNYCFPWKIKPSSLFILTSVPAVRGGRRGMEFRNSLWAHASLITVAKGCTWEPRCCSSSYTDGDRYAMCIKLTNSMEF